MNNRNYQKLTITRISDNKELTHIEESGKQLRYIEEPVILTTEFIISQADYEKLLIASQKKRKSLLEHIQFIIQSSASHTKL